MLSHSQRHQSEWGTRDAIETEYVGQRVREISAHSVDLGPV